MHVVIFCGGFGTRMWPVSRKAFPKQFYPLLSGKSFFEITYRRFRKAFTPEEIFVSSEDKYVPFIKKQASGIPKANIISEPERRDNLAAIGLAAATLEKRFPGEVMFTSWCDHLIKDEDKFLEDVSAASLYAQDTGFIVSLGEAPSYPSVHNGWAKLGETIDEFKGWPIMKIVKHIEKPDLPAAKKMFINGGYLINTGYRAWKTDTMLSFYREFQPEIYNGLVKIMEGSQKSYKDTILYREYHKFKKESVDSGIFEKLGPESSVIIPIEVGWKDAGTWELLYRALKSKEDQNVKTGGETEFLDSEGNLVVGQEGKMIALIGVKALAIIDTPDGLLVGSLNQTDKVKKLFSILEKDKTKFI